MSFSPTPGVAADTLRAGPFRQNPLAPRADPLRSDPLQNNPTHGGAAQTPGKAPDSVRLSLSPQARGLAPELPQRGTTLESGAPDKNAAEAATGTDIAPLPGDVEKIVFGALENMRGDLGHFLGSLGFGGAEQDSFAAAFVEPAIAALNAGVDFSAELSFTAFSQVTRISGSNFSQSTSLEARSLEIDVNRSTGEVTVTMASLSIQQDIYQSGGIDASPIIDLATGLPPEADTPATETAAPAAPTADEPVPAPSGDDTSVEESYLEKLLRDSTEALLAQQREFISRLSLRSVENYHDELGYPHTKLNLDAATPIPGANTETSGNGADERSAVSLSA